MPYYNIASLTGDFLKKAWADAESQDDKIIVLFMKFPETLFNPFDVLRKVFDHNTPVTSIRRSLNTLTNDGKIIKTETQTMGEYGKLCHCWKLSV